MSHHPDDNFHTPKDDDPFWTETSWFTFAVPERQLSGQLYPFFRPNLGVAACAVYLWDDQGHAWPDALYARQCWQLKMPYRPLWDMELPNSLHYECLEPRMDYRLRYSDPDGDDVHVDLTFRATIEPMHDGHGHLDQPGRVSGSITLDGEVIPVDSYGFRDRSWGRRGNFGRRMARGGGRYGGYSFATFSDQAAFHSMTFQQEDHEEVASVAGFLQEDGVVAKLRHGVREVVERDPETGYQKRIRIVAEDELGRTLIAEGETVNRFGFLLNPNIWSVNCLTRWTFNGREAWGEDHDNWSASGYRRFFRDFKGYAPALARIVD